VTRHCQLSPNNGLRKFDRARQGVEGLDMAIKHHSQSDRLLSRKDLSERWNLSTKTLKRREKAGELRPLTLSANCVRYRLSEILAIEEDAAARM